MKTIIIPGYSHKNKEWADETCKNLKTDGIDAQVYNWKHWSDPNIKFDPKGEAENIKKLIGESPTNIVAKSMGTLVAVLILKSDPAKIGRIILCGTCINDLHEDGLHEYKILSDFPSEKILAFQNSEDFHGTFEEVRRFFSQINPNVKIVEKPGSTHEYPYYEEFNEFLKNA